MFASYLLCGEKQSKDLKSTEAFQNYCLERIWRYMVDEHRMNGNARAHKSSSSGFDSGKTSSWKRTSCCCSLEDRHSLALNVSDLFNQRVSRAGRATQMIMRLRFD